MEPSPAEILARTIDPARFQHGITELEHSVPRKVYWPGNELQRIRESLGIPLQDAAAAVGMSKPGYWFVEKGSNVILANAVRIAKFYGRTIEEIWHGDPATPPKRKQQLRRKRRAA